MKKDSHGGNIYKKAKELGLKEDELLDYSANISPLGIPVHIKEAMIQAISGTIHYPDPECSDLKEAIARNDGLEKEWIACGNGGADMLYRLAFGLKPGKVLLPVPAFVEYEEALQAVGSEMEYYYMEKDFRIKRDILDQITEEIDLIILCNPNNPTGLLTERTLIFDILKKAKEVKATLLLDECFLEICVKEQEYTLKPFVEKYDNLMILKSFTKLYAIPGVRLGYLISSNEDIIERVNRAGQAWSVSHIAQCAGIAALSEKTYKQKVIKIVEEERQFLCEALKSLPIILYEGQANYLFFRAPGVTDLDKRMEKKGIMIRNCSNYVNLGKDYWRTAVKGREDNIRFVQAIREVFAANDNTDAEDIVK